MEITGSNLRNGDLLLDPATGETREVGRVEPMGSRTDYCRNRTAFIYAGDDSFLYSVANDADLTVTRS